MTSTELCERFPTLTYDPPVKPPAPRIDPTALVLGKDPDGKPVSLPLRTRLEHCFILGSTGSGKSRLLLHFMRQAIKRGEGLLFLDPHGSHPDSDYRNLLLWLASRDRHVHLIDLNAPRIIGFNPLACPPGTDPSVVASNVVDALAISWEGESFAQRPTIERVLFAILTALIELKLTLCEAPYIIDRTDEKGLRRYAIQHVKDPYTRDELKRLNELGQDGRRKRDYDQEVVGPHNRFARLLRPPVLRGVLGKSDGCLNVRTAMDNGEVILANLSGSAKVDEKAADLFGRLLTRSTLFEAKRRTNAHPFSLVLDEAHRFLSSDIPVLLAEVRKYGISVVAAMQWLEQARTQDENILAALLNVNCKICFRLRDAKESEELARSLIPLNLEHPVSALIKPTVVGHRRTNLANHSTGETDVRTEGTSRGESRGRAVMNGETVTRSHADFHSMTVSEGVSEQEASSEGETSGSGESAAEIMLPAPTNDLMPGAATVTRTTTGASASSAASSSHSKGRGRSRASATSIGAMDGVSYAQSRAVTDSLSVSHTENRSRALGTSRSNGESEALEPVLEDLPSAVHSIQNELYAAGLLLRSLPTATGFVTYVGRNGPVSTLFTVPPILDPTVEHQTFLALRDALLPLELPKPPSTTWLQERKTNEESTPPRKTGTRRW